MTGSRDKAERIGLLGGTFDPPHLGHLKIARAAKRKFKLDRVIFVPCDVSPFKTGNEPSASPTNRLKMLKLLIKNKPWCDISTFELELKGASYSYRTAEHFHRLYPRSELFWILGTDQWERLDEWKNLSRLAELVTFIVFSRPDPPQTREGIRHLHLHAPIDISSSMIRDFYRSEEKGGRTVRSFLPQSVHGFIRREGLYRS